MNNKDIAQYLVGTIHVGEWSGSAKLEQRGVDYAGIDISGNFILAVAHDMTGCTHITEPAYEYEASIKTVRIVRTDLPGPTTCPGCKSEHRCKLQNYKNNLRLRSELPVGMKENVIV